MHTKLGLAYNERPGSGFVDGLREIFTCGEIMNRRFYIIL